MTRRGFAAPSRQSLSQSGTTSISPYIAGDGVRQLALAGTGLQLPRLFEDGLDVVVVAVVRPEVAVVLALGLPGGIVVPPQEISAAFPSGHFRRLSNKPYNLLTSTLQFCKVCQSVNLILKIF